MPAGFVRRSGDRFRKDFFTGGKLCVRKHGFSGTELDWEYSALCWYSE
jgi:GH18 family chitinase